MKKLNKIAEQVMQLEQECQQGINILENLEKMEDLMKDLSLEELLQMDEILNKKFS